MLYGQSFQLSAVSDLVRVFDDGYKRQPMKDTIEVFGIRGEVISAQCVILAKNDLTRVTASASPLKNDRTGSPLKGNIDVNFVGSIYLTENAPNQPAGSVTRRAPARFPDYLMAEKQMDVKGGTDQSVWLTIHIPQGAPPGSFLGSVKIKGDQGERSLPIRLTVYPLTLPGDRHLKVTEWYNTNNFERFHGIEEKYSRAWFTMLSRYAANMAAHRQNVFQVPVSAIGISKPANGAFKFDFRRFDDIAQVFWDTGKMDYLETGELAKFKDDWFSTEILLKDLKVADDETGKMTTVPGKEVVPSLLAALENHLRQKGWLDKTLFHIKDEPSLHNALAWRGMSSYVHQYAPSLKRIDAIETTYLLEDIEVAVPKLDAFGTWFQSYDQARQNGTEIWFYTVGIYQGTRYPNKTIDMPLIDNRILHWLNYRFDATGFLHWGWNQWTDDPYHNVGQHIGDAWHVYPVRDGVVNSLRWEEMRNGIQDYEYFWMLENRIRTLKDSLGTSVSWIDPRQRGKEIATPVAPTLSEHTRDPHVLENAKRKVIMELLALRDPAVYVQTNPAEYSRLTSGSAVEVFGWCEPGSKVTVNGKALPVSEKGVFLEQFSVTPDNSRITVEVSDGGRKRQIIREFRVD